MGAAAVKVAQAANYTNAGTVEFLLDESGHYYFLEMNTRIQVEHPVTEMITGVDLVVEQIRVAAGLPLSKELQNLSQRGHAIECRINAEDGENNFMPSTGTVLLYNEPVGPGIRVDSGIDQGSEITINYDPIMAKLIVHSSNRESAISKMIDALKQYKILGVKTSRKFMIEVLEHPDFVAGKTYTNFIEKNMSTRATEWPEIGPLAAAAASIAAETSPTAITATGKATLPTPWQLLGDWQVGGSIRG